MNMTFLNEEINFATLSPEQISEMTNQGQLVLLENYAQSHLRYPVLVSEEVWKFVIDNDAFLTDTEKEKAIKIKSLDVCNMLSFYINSFYANDTETIEFPMIRMTSNLSQEITLSCNSAVNKFDRRVYIISI